MTRQQFRKKINQSIGQSSSKYFSNSDLNFDVWLVRTKAAFSN